MMNHARMMRQLSAYLDGELTAADAGDVRAHLAVCPRCRAELDDLTHVKSLLGHLPEGVPLEDLWIAVRARLARPGWSTLAEAFRSMVRRPAAVTAAALLLVVLMNLPFVRGRLERLRAAGTGVDLYVREHALVSATDPFADRAYIGLLVGDAGLALAGAPRGEGEEARR